MKKSNPILIFSIRFLIVLSVWFSLATFSSAQEVKKTNSATGSNKVLKTVITRHNRVYRCFRKYEFEDWQEIYCPTPQEFVMGYWESSIEDWPKPVSRWEIKKILGNWFERVDDFNFRKASYWNLTDLKTFNRDTYAGVSFPRDFKLTTLFSAKD